jgi:hypothetical protein
MGRGMRGQNKSLGDGNAAGQCGSTLAGHGVNLAAAEIDLPEGGAAVVRPRGANHRARRSVAGTPQPVTPGRLGL